MAGGSLLSISRRLTMKTWSKTTLYLWTALSVTAVCTLCFAQTYDQSSSQSPQNNSPGAQNWANSLQNWKNSPDNWQNSSQNWQNSSQNWQNSPGNWQNSGNNYYNTNGIYDSNGNRIGYSVPSANGGVNYFNNNGSRRGYQPGR
jgi:predicted PurR-regulated permease PerM